MDRRTKKSFQLRSKQKEYKNRVKYSKQIIEKAYEKFNKPYLAYSGGKDSVVMLHLALQIDPDIPIWNWDHGPYLMPREYQKEIINNAYKIGVNKEQLHIRTTKQLNTPDARWDYMRWYRGFFGNLHPLIKNEGWDVALIGLRMEESSARKIKAKKPFNFTVDKFCPQCYPVHTWTWEDVWAYTISNKLPYLQHYEAYSEFAGWDRSRICTFFDNEFQHKNSIDGVLMSDYRNLK